MSRLAIYVLVLILACTGAGGFYWSYARIKGGQDLQLALFGELLTEDDPLYTNYYPFFPSSGTRLWVYRNDSSLFQRFRVQCSGRIEVVLHTSGPVGRFRGENTRLCIIANKIDKHLHIARQAVITERTFEVYEHTY
jgi:hypothetical protein